MSEPPAAAPAAGPGDPAPAPADGASSTPAPALAQAGVASSGDPTRSRTGWRYPETAGDRFSRLLRRVLRVGLALAGGLALLLGALWGIPTAVVWRSPAWAAARERAADDPEVRSWVGTPSRAAALPAHWRLAPGDAGRFRLVVEGPFGRALVEVEVEAGARARRPRLLQPVVW